MTTTAPVEYAPVEYAAAVERYLGQAPLGPASRRVYRISLASWSWPLVGRAAPQGARRRGAAPPFVPLARLDDPDAGPALAAALQDRAAGTDVRTVNRELSALRSAVAWWQDQRWISRDPTAGLHHLAGPPPPQPALTGSQLTRLFQAAPTLRDHALWRVLHDSGAPADEVLRLNAGSLDLARHRGRPTQATAPHGPGQWIGWGGASTELLRWLIAGRPEGPVFLTSRRALAATPGPDVCLLTGRARLSYRRAAEIFTEVARPLDPAGRGWTLSQLRP
ncbi:MAG: site-specific recombinase [Streptosporangiaceae bacterium]